MIFTNYIRFPLQSYSFAILFQFHFNRKNVTLIFPFFTNLFLESFDFRVEVPNQILLSSYFE